MNSNDGRPRPKQAAVYFGRDQPPANLDVVCAADDLKPHGDPA